MAMIKIELSIKQLYGLHKLLHDYIHNSNSSFIYYYKDPLYKKNYNDCTSAYNLKDLIHREIINYENKPK